jgi:hypothetical protein
MNFHLPLGSRTVPILSYRLLTSQNCNSQRTKPQLRVRVTLRLAVYRQLVRLGDKPLETHDHKFFFQLNLCSHSPYVTSSVTRGRVCRLQLQMVLASAVILGSCSAAGLMTTFYCLRFETPPTCRARSQI